MQAAYVAGQLVLWCLLALAPLVHAQVQRTDGLRLWWRFAEAGGLTAYDSSGKQLSGILYQGPVRVRDPQRGPAVALNGTTAFVYTPDASLLNPGTGAWSITVWVKNTTSTKAGYVLKDNPTCTDVTGPGFCLYHDPNGNDYYYTGATAVLVGAGTTTWKHLAVTRAVGGALATYANGVLVATDTDTRNYANASAFVLGAFNDGTGLVTGRAADLRLYGRALAAAEIAAVYREGLMPLPAPSVLGFAGALLAAPTKPGAFFRFFEPQ